MALKAVCLVKQTLPTEAKISIQDNGKPGDAKAKPIMNPYDEFAVEEAVKLKEAGKVSEITLLSVGEESWVETLRRGLAMGADKAVLVLAGGETEEAAVAAAIAAKIRQLGADLVLCGKVAVDSNAGEVPGRVAALLDMPLLHVATQVEVDGSKVTVHRVADGNTIVVEAQVPVMVSADKSLNKPRYPNLPSIMKAKQKPLEKVALADLLNGFTPTRRTVAVELPPARGPVRMIDGDTGAAAKSLVDVLVNQEKIVH